MNLSPPLLPFETLWTTEAELLLEINPSPRTENLWLQQANPFSVETENFPEEWEVVRPGLEGHAIPSMGEICVIAEYKNGVSKPTCFNLSHIDY